MNLGEMYRWLIVALLLCPFSMCVKGQVDDDNASLLVQLDEMLANSDQYYGRREARIAELRAVAAATTNVEERFWRYKDIFWEYRYFDSDSAFVYGWHAVDMAESMGRHDLVNELYITLSYILAATGKLDESRAQLDKVQEGALTQEARFEYLEQKIYLLTHQVMYGAVMPGAVDISEQTQLLLDSIVAQSDSTSSNYYFLLACQSRSNVNSARSAIRTIERHKYEWSFDNLRDAKLTWALSQLYGKVGDEERYVHYLILSAMSDLRIGNREIASLQDLARLMDKQGDLSRANNYITHCLRCAELYKDRGRALSIASKQRDISLKYQSRLIELQDQTNEYLLLMGLLAFVLVLSLLYIYRQHRHLVSKNSELTKVNEDAIVHMRELSNAYSCLATKNEDLLQMSNNMQVANEEREKRNAAYISILGDALATCSKHIDKIEERRLTISRLLKTNSLEQARRYADSQELLQGDIKDFYVLFDRLFLSLYPDFVADFNALLQPGETVMPKEEGRLNTELRIYALVYLGITDSVSIASVLHCSVQTVYNKRMKTRNKAQEQRVDFVEKVQSLRHTKTY